MRDIEIELSGTSFGFIGETGAVRDAVASALRTNSGNEVRADEASLIVAIYPLIPTEAGIPDLLPELRRHGERLAAGDGGRMVMLLSAAASVPMRRHPAYSAQMAMAWAGMRTLAMTLAPNVLVNAVGVGLAEAGGTTVGGDPIMLGHAGLPRAGQMDDVINTVLFLSDPANSYTTGQLLNVDGGWTIGYGRNF